MQRAAFVFFLFWFILAWAIAPDYGISYDEPLQRDLGFANAQYINEALGLGWEKLSNRILAEQPNRYHGPVFTTTAFWLERWLEPDNFHQAYLLRHRFTAVLFWSAGLALFGISLMMFGKSWWTLLPPLLLLLSPRQFAHGFYNPKDIPLLVFYCWSMWAAARFLTRDKQLGFWRELGLLLILAITSGMAVAQRPSGLILPVVACVLLLVDTVYRKKGWWNLPVYIGLLALFIVVFWPILWPAPFSELKTAMTTMTQFNWDGPMLFRGNIVRSVNLPWYYLPGWMSFSIPLGYLFFGLLGLIMLPLFWVRKLNKRQKWWNEQETVVPYLLFGSGLAPLVAYFLLQPVIYDGWRHFYFAYPPLLTLGVWAAWSLPNRWKKTSIAILGIQAIWIVGVMITMHPHQNTYFNLLAGQHQFGRFAMDYWGNGYNQAWKKLAKRYPADTLIVATNEWPGYLNWQFQKNPELRKQFRFTEERTEADIYLTHYRYWHDWRQSYYEKGAPFDGVEIDSVMAGPNKIIGIYLRPKESD